MTQFYSEYNVAQKQYEDRLAEAHASDQNARARSRKTLEDKLVEEGETSIDEYVKLLNWRWENARCLAEYDGINMGYTIANNARQRLANKQG